MSCGQQSMKNNGIFCTAGVPAPAFFAVCRTFGRMHKFRRIDIVDKHKKTGVYPETFCRMCAKSDRV